MGLMSHWVRKIFLRFDKCIESLVAVLFILLFVKRTLKDLNI